ncbi:hypothetical protein DBR12_03630 [Acidovorax sp. HMWF029]|nr:hypothetical protein DBR12_03630 [Acidovorax sp. HMWF029]
MMEVWRATRHIACTAAPAAGSAARLQPGSGAALLRHHNPVAACAFGVVQRLVGRAPSQSAQWPPPQVTQARPKLMVIGILSPRSDRSICATAEHRRWATAVATRAVL